ncbi:MAG: hypothetical protein ACI87H_002267, partial [Gammaproteobacteria bacterium]
LVDRDDWFLVYHKNLHLSDTLGAVRARQIFCR